jgi:hypothetical protein
LSKIISDVRKSMAVAPSNEHFFVANELLIDNKFQICYFTKIKMLLDGYPIKIHFSVMAHFWSIKALPLSYRL